MKKFGCGILVTIAFLGAVAAIWFSLGEQTKGVVVGLVLGGTGMLIGLALGLAVVAIFLLSNLRWQIQGGGHPPVIHGPGQQAALPAPDPQYTYYPPHQAPPWARPVRAWRGLGIDEIPAEARPLDE